MIFPLQYWQCQQRQSQRLVYGNVTVLAILFSSAALVLIEGCSRLHKRSPFPDADRLVKIVKVAPSAREEAISDRDFLEWRNRSQTLGLIAAYTSRGFNRTDLAVPERMFCGLVTADFFLVLGVQPSLGRVFLPEEYQPGRGHVVVVSHSLWQRSFGGDPGVIGRAVTFDQEKYTVIGIMPSGFALPEQYDVWLPLTPDDESMRLEDRVPEPKVTPKLKPGITILTDKNAGLNVIARLKSGVTLQQAKAEMNTIARDLGKKYPETNNGRSVKLTSLLE